MTDDTWPASIACADHSRLQSPRCTPPPARRRLRASSLRLRRSRPPLFPARPPAFPVLLQGTGTFRPLSPVVYVRVAGGADRIVTLESDVRSGPLQRNLRFEFHPHVTIAHDLPEPTLVVAQRTLADYEAAFTADAITLYEMGSDGVWGPLRDFELSAPA